MQEHTEYMRMHFVMVYREIVNKITLLWRQACWDLMLAYSVKLTVPELLVLSEASAVLRISDTVSTL